MPDGSGGKEFCNIPASRQATGGRISPDGPVLALVVPTDEELMIARDTARLIAGT